MQTERKMEDQVKISQGDYPTSDRLKSSGILSRLITLMQRRCNDGGFPLENDPAHGRKGEGKITV